MTTWRPSSPPASQQDPPRLSESIDRISRRLGGPSSSASSAVFSRWPQVVGADIAAHARPVSLRGGILLLAVDDPAWAAQLRFMEGDLVARIGEEVGSVEVREIHVKVVG